MNSQEIASRDSLRKFTKEELIDYILAISFMVRQHPPVQTILELKAEKIHKNQEENRQNGVDIQEMIRSRRQAELTIRDCAQALGVSLSKYSDYEHERAPMPLQEWQKIMAIIREEVSHGNHSRTITSTEPYSRLGAGKRSGSHAG